jgi:hypothetical protein
MKKDIKAKRIKLMDRIRLSSEFPKIPIDNEYEVLNYKIVKKSKYELMEKIVGRVDNYIEQIKICNRKIEEQKLAYKELNNKVDEINQLFNKRENSRKITASKVGGLKSSLNHQKEKNKILLDLNKNLTEKLTQAEKKLERANNQVEFFKNHRRAPSLQEYENYIKCNHELEKRQKNEER